MSGFFSQPFASICTSCSGGTYTINSQSCEVCPPGTYSISGSSMCSPCPAGKTIACPSLLKYHELKLLLSYLQYLFPWTLGQISAASSSLCVSCTAGSYSVNSQLCEFCPPGTYSISGSSMCHPCPAGKTAYL